MTGVYKQTPGGVLMPEQGPPKEVKKPPRISAATRAILDKGGGILLPFDAGDAPVTFASRWELARMIEAALAIARDDDPYNLRDL